MQPNDAPLRPEQVHLTTGARSDLLIAVVVNSTVLGQALGGCRLKPYATWRDGVADAERLAAAMTEKCALAGLNYGGGKTVVTVPVGPPPAGTYRRDVMLDIGDAVAALDGRYATGPDIGTAPTDMSVIATRTSHVFCRPEADGGSGDSSGPTADGILAAIAALAAHERRRLTKVSIVGLGHVGLRIASGLAAAGMNIVAADLDQGRQRAAEKLGAAWVPVEDALRADVDLLVPAATGGLLTRDLVDEMRCRAVLGPANNQLDAPQTAEALHARGIVWAPDPIVSAGGVIYATAIEREGCTAREARQRVMAIGETIAAVLDEARGGVCHRPGRLATEPPRGWRRNGRTIARSLSARSGSRTARSPVPKPSTSRVRRPTMAVEPDRAWRFWKCTARLADTGQRCREPQLAPVALTNPNG